MSDEDGQGVGRQALVLGWVEEEVAPQADGHQDIKASVWTGRRFLKAHASKSEHLARDEVNDVVDNLIASGEVVTWHGLLTLNRPEYLRAVVANENQSEITRCPLVGKCNKLLQGDRERDPAAEADEIDRGRGVETDGGSESEIDRRKQERVEISHLPHIDGVTRGTVLEYDDWQWAVVTEIATEKDPTRVGFVLVDELGDSIVTILEDASGCWEHYDAVKAYRWSNHEYWTDADHLQDDIWSVLGPVHPDAREDNQEMLTDGGESLTCDVSDCDEPAHVRVFPTHGETDHSALRCRDCYEYDAGRDWFDRWASQIRDRDGGEAGE